MSTSPNFTLTSAKRSFRLKSELAVCVTFVNDFFVNISRLVFPCSLPWPFARLLWHFAAVMETRETQRRRTELTWSHGRNFWDRLRGHGAQKLENTNINIKRSIQDYKQADVFPKYLLTNFIAACDFCGVKQCLRGLTW